MSYMHMCMCMHMCMHNPSVDQGRPRQCLPCIQKLRGQSSSDAVVRRRAHAGADTTAGRSRCSQAEEDLLRMPRYSQAAR